MFPSPSLQAQLVAKASLEDGLLIPKKSKDNDFLRTLVLRPRRLSPSPEPSLKLSEAKPFGLEDPRPFEFCPRCPSRDIFHPPL